MYVIAYNHMQSRDIRHARGTRHAFGICHVHGMTKSVTRMRRSVLCQKVATFCSRRKIKIYKMAALMIDLLGSLIEERCTVAILAGSFSGTSVRRAPVHRPAILVARMSGRGVGRGRGVRSRAGMRWLSGRCRHAWHVPGRFKSRESMNIDVQERQTSLIMWLPVIA